MASDQPRGAAGTHDADGAFRAFAQDRPGDPPCLLRRVCPACGSVAETDPPTTCPRCHAQMPGD
jgi:rubrerythrin